jgi:hypothetical protein
MRSVTYSMGISLDGYIVGPDGDFDWTAPDEEVFRSWIDEIQDRRPGSIARRLNARVGRDLEAAPKGGVLHHAVGGAGPCPPGLRQPGGEDRRVYPVLVGGGIPFFPQRERRVDLELVETRTFSSRVVYLRYRVAR